MGVDSGRSFSSLFPLQDKFMDVPLVIKPFGATDRMTSVDESLKKFVEVERLEVRAGSEGC